MDKFGETKGDEACQASTNDYEIVYGWSELPNFYGVVGLGIDRGWSLM